MRIKKIIKLFFLTILLTGCVKKELISKKNFQENKKQNSIFIWKKNIQNCKKQKNNNLKLIYEKPIIYSANENGYIQAINIKSGKTIWFINLKRKKYLTIFKLDKLIITDLTISKKECYLSTENGILISLNKKNGKIIWWTNSILGEASSQILNNNILLIYTQNGILQALDLNSRKNKWIVNLGNPFLSIRKKQKPIIIYDYIIVFDDFGRMTSILLKKGDIIWQKYIFSKQFNYEQNYNPFKNTILNSVVDIREKTIYAETYNGELLAIQLNSQKIIWKKKIQPKIKNILSFQKNLYFIDKNDYIISISKKNGNTTWSQKKLYKKNITKITIYKNNLLIGDKNGYIYLFDKKNGKLIKKNKISKLRIQSILKISTNKLLIILKNGIMCLINFF